MAAKATSVQADTADIAVLAATAALVDFQALMAAKATSVQADTADIAVLA